MANPGNGDCHAFVLKGRRSFRVSMSFLSSLPLLLVMILFWVFLLFLFSFLLGFLDWLSSPLDVLLASQHHGLVFPLWFVL